MTDGKIVVLRRFDAGAVTTVLCDADGNLFPSEEPAFDASVEVTNRTWPGSVSPRSAPQRAFASRRPARIFAPQPLTSPYKPVFRSRSHLRTPIRTRS